MTALNAMNFLVQQEETLRQMIAKDFSVDEDIVVVTRPRIDDTNKFEASLSFYSIVECSLTTYGNTPAEAFTKLCIEYGQFREYYLGSYNRI